MAEIKPVEAQNPVYADAKRQMEKTNQLRIDTTKVEKEVKREEKPKRPKMAQGAKKMHLDESLFENDNVDKEVREIRNFMSKSGMPPKKSVDEHKKFLTKLNQVRKDRVGNKKTGKIGNNSLDEARVGKTNKVITRRVPVENLKESASYDNIEFVKSFLNKLVSDNRIRALKDGERLPRGFTFKSSSGTNGEITYKGTDYAYALVNGKLKVMPSRDAGYNWSETIYKESLNNMLKDGSTIEEAYTCFEFKSGANPYIAKTEKEKQRILNKYKGKVKETKKGFYEIDDRKSDNFLPEAVTNLNAKKYTAQEFVDIATSNGVEGADIILDWDDTANKREYFNVWKSYLLDTYLDLEDDLYNMSEQDTIKRNRDTVIYPLMDLREPEVINESLNEELDDETKLEVKTELINMTRAYPNEHGFNVKTAEIKDFVKKELESMGYEVEISGDDRVNPMQYHIEYFKKLNESKLIEETGPYYGNIYLEKIADDLDDGSDYGYINDFEWVVKMFSNEGEITENGTSPRFYEYMLHEISYPVRDGHLSYTDLNIVLSDNIGGYYNIHNFTDKDLKLLGFSEEEITDFRNGKEIETWIDYEIESNMGIEDIDNEDLGEKLNESKIIEGAKSFLRTLGKDDIQYFTHKNRFNYDLKQIRIDNKNKTYEYGNFAWTNRQESTQNGKEFERLVDKLKEMGYTEIKKPLKENKTYKVYKNK